MFQLALTSQSLPAMGIGEAKLHTLQFADDMLLFFDGTTKAAAAIKLILDAFSAYSGLKINFQKSVIIPVNLTTDQTSALADFLGCSTQTFPFTYLGLPLSPKKLRKADYVPLIEKLDNRLAGWKGLLLSRGGRLVLLNSTLSTIPTFLCSAFALPAWVIKAVDKTRRGFFWRGKKLDNGFHCLVKWEELCRPKRNGGIGIRNIKSMNIALLLKTLWNFYSNPTLPWVQLLLQKHYRRTAPPLDSPTSSAYCPIWRDILKVAAPFLSSVDFQIGKGSAVSFWSARWCGSTPPRYLFPHLYAATKRNLQHLSVSYWYSRFASSAYLGFAAPLNLQEHAEVQHLTSLLNSIPLSDISVDFPFWRWTSSAMFSVRSAYAFLHYDGVNNSKAPFLWNLKVPLRIKIFLWLAARNKLLTADCLAKIGWHGPSICVLCNSHAETLHHLLFRCPYASSLWKWLLGPHVRTLPSRDDSIAELGVHWSNARRSFSGRNKISFDLVFSACCWELWNERNKRLFEDHYRSLEVLGRCILSTAGLWESTFGAQEP